jgi:hypothetical protein
MKPNASAVCLFVVLLGTTAPAIAQEQGQSRSSQERRSFFLIGNSLTWDTVPSQLDGDTQWHVDCGKSLPFMVANPDEPCVKSSTLWPEALKQKQYDVVAIQVHYGSTLTEDVSAISKLIEQQPEARVVIHTGWARSASRAEEWASDQRSPTASMSHSPVWFDALLMSLREKHPDRSFERTRAMDLLQQVEHDIAAGQAPIEGVEDLYRDKIHMNVVTGRYLMHNAMRDALGQPRSAQEFEKLTPEMKGWLDTVLDRVLEQEAGPGWQIREAESRD